MREAAMEQNENLKEAIANGDLSIGDLEMDIRNGLTASDLGTRMYSIDVEEDRGRGCAEKTVGKRRECRRDTRKTKIIFLDLRPCGCGCKIPSIRFYNRMIVLYRTIIYLFFIP